MYSRLRTCSSSHALGRKPVRAYMPCRRKSQQHLVLVVLLDRVGEAEVEAHHAQCAESHQSHLVGCQGLHLPQISGKAVRFRSSSHMLVDCLSATCEPSAAAACSTPKNFFCHMLQNRKLLVVVFRRHPLALIVCRMGA